jgi:hypothetical protein
MPEILHQEQGLTIKRNDTNRVVVVSLLYYADPAKRSKIWEQEARAGVSNAKFAQEYLIDYTAQFGEKMFPEITEKRSKIVIPVPHPEIPETNTFWGGFDYGAKNPSAFIVYTKDREGHEYAVWELYKPCKNLKDFVAEMKSCPYWDRIKYIQADPSIWKNDQRKGDGNLTSMYMLFVEEGLHNLVAGSTDETAWITLIRAAWSPEEPTFKIYSCCPNLIREFEGAVYASMSDKLQMTSNYKEHMVDHNNHALDADKYYRLSRPKLASKKPPAGKMVNRWIK